MDIDKAIRNVLLGVFGAVFAGSLGASVVSYVRTREGNIAPAE